MASFGGARKRVRPEGTLNGNGEVAGFKRSKEMDAQSGLGRKSKPCTKFFSTAGCPFGEGCHFLHYVPGGYNAVAAQMPSLGNPSAHALPPRGPMGPPVPDSHRAPPSSVKTKMCNNFSSPGGCKFGDKCRFAHGERELGAPMSSHNGPMGGPQMGPGRMGGPHMEPQPPVGFGAAASFGASATAMGTTQPPAGFGAAASFGASATAKISVDASLAGAIIGKGGVNTKQICRFTGAKLAIRDHESDANLRNIELEGTFDQIKQASAMVRELIVNISAANPMPIKTQSAAPPASQQPASNYKTKLCDNFAKGTCTFGDRCHFAHGANELRKSAV